MTLANPNPPHGELLLRAATSELGLWCAGMAALLLIGLAGGWWLLKRLHAGPGPATATTGRSEDGTATVEFALVFPILLFIILALAQTTWLMSGNVFVHYAAFAAARSAIVQIPAVYPDDPANRLTVGGRKHEAITRAAIFAVMPAAGRSESGGQAALASQFTAGLSEFYERYDRDEPRWVQTLAADRLRYAAGNTSVDVLRPIVVGDDSIAYEDIDQHTFAPRDPVTTLVTHRLNLGVPYVNRLFADGENLDGRGLHAVVSARYTLTNEGVRDELPPAPTLPREDP